MKNFIFFLGGLNFTYFTLIFFCMDFSNKCDRKETLLNEVFKIKIKIKKRYCLYMAIKCRQKLNMEYTVFNTY